MINNKSVLALIPARSGSKGIIDKNIKKIKNKELIGYSIEHALTSKYIDKVIVSTDSKKYAKISRKYGAETPFLRPKKISQDLSTDLDVFIHVLKWLKQNAKKEIKKSITIYSSHLNVKVKSIFIKDMITKWGSCSTKKDLTFSWRIIFFPNYVSNYIIAHEVAHLVEFNHSKKFWNNVKKIYGNFKSANSWMEKNSKKFYRYGISS